MTPDLEQRLRDVLGAQPGLSLAYVFGSQWSGRSRPDSDLDIALVYERGTDAPAREDLRRRVVAALADELGQLGERADILDLEHAGSAIAFRVIRYGRRLLDRDPVQRVRLEAFIARRYDDEAPRRALFRQAAARVAARMGERLRG